MLLIFFSDVLKQNIPCDTMTYRFYRLGGNAVKKKILAVMLSLTMVASLGAGCGQRTKESKETTKVTDLYVNATGVGGGR